MTTGAQNPMIARVIRREQARLSLEMSHHLDALGTACLAGEVVALQGGGARLTEPSLMEEVQRHVRGHSDRDRQQRSSPRGQQECKRDGERAVEDADSVVGGRPCLIEEPNCLDGVEAAFMDDEPEVVVDVNEHAASPGREHSAPEHRVQDSGSC